MASPESLDRLCLGAWVVRAIVVVTGAVGTLVGIALARVAVHEPLVLLAAAPVLVFVAAMARQLWRLGIYQSADGIVIQRVTGRLLLPWDVVQQARVDSVKIGMRPQRAVVVASRNGDEVSLYLWNERSLLMLGSSGGVDALAARINTAIALHQGR